VPFSKQCSGITYFYYHGCMDTKLQLGAVSHTTHNGYQKHEGSLITKLPANNQ